MLANNIVTSRRTIPSVFLALLIVTVFYYRDTFFSASNRAITWRPVSSQADYKVPANFKWENVKPRYPVKSYIPLPTESVRSLPKIQHTPTVQSDEAVRSKQQRLQAVKAEFIHAWTGYKQHAWLKDEVAPISGGFHNPFGGWAATLVDALGQSFPHATRYS
jgi:hypothetical protein